MWACTSAVMVMLTPERLSADADAGPALIRPLPAMPPAALGVNALQAMRSVGSAASKSAVVGMSPPPKLVSAPLLEVVELWCVWANDTDSDASSPPRAAARAALACWSTAHAVCGIKNVGRDASTA